MSDNEEFVPGLIQLGHYLGNHPEVLDRVYSHVNFYIPVYEDSEIPNSARTQMQRWARILAPCEKNYDTQDFELKKRFGPHTITVYTARENVCERRIVGTEKVEKRTYTADDQRAIDAMERVTILEEKEIVEWVCPPSLLGD